MKLTYAIVLLGLLILTGCEDQLSTSILQVDRTGQNDTYYIDTRTLNNDTVTIDFSDNFDENGTFRYRVDI